MSSVSSRTPVDFLLRIWGDEIELNATTKAQDSASCVLVDQAIQI